MQITVIINPISGGVSPARGLTRADVARRVLGRTAATAQIVTTEHRNHARELAAAAVDQRADRVIAWGGDGTINEVASVLVGTDVALGIIPAGSGNGLARELGIPLRSESALLHAVTSRPRPIDAGEVGGRLFVNVAGIGIDAYVAARFNAPDNRRRGFAGYALHAMTAMLRYRADEYVIDTPGRRWTVRALLLAIANSAQWGNNARIAPGARLDDGQLDLVVVGHRSPWSMAVHIPQLFVGGIQHVRGCSVERIERATIASVNAIPFHVDGEPAVGGTIVEVRVLPGALRVCA